MILMSKHIAWQKINNTVFVINEHSKKAFHLTDVAADIWLSITNGYEMPQILEHLSDIYAADTETLRCDLVDYIGQLKSEGLLMP